jgi:tetratricopeptide (TPR) repeat protein
MRPLSCNVFFKSIIFLAIVLMALPAFAEGNINVQCTDQSGAPVQGVQVRIQHLQANKWKDKKSDAKGLAPFTKIDDGVYRVIGRKEGLAPAFYEFVLLKGGANETVNLKFQPGDMNQKVYFEDQAVSQKAFESLSRAVEMLRNNKLADADKELRASLEINPSSPDAHFNLAIALIQERKWDEADQELKRVSGIAAALAELPAAPTATGPNPYVEMGQRVKDVQSKIPALKLRDEGDKALAEKKFDQAISSYDQAAKLDPSDPDLFYNLALAQANAKKYDEASATIDKALKLKPGEAAYLDMKKRLADMKLNETLTQAKGILEAGDQLYKNADYAGALKKYEEARAMVPEAKQSGILAQEGRCYAQLKNPEEAVKAFNKAIEISPDDPNYRKALAQYYMTEKKYDEALNVYADPRATGSEPADKVMFNMGMAQNKAGNSEVAMLAFERALKVNPQNAEAYYELGALVFYEKKDYKRAQELLNKYVELGKDEGHINNAKSLLVVISRKK